MSIKKTTEEFKIEVYELFKDEYIVLEEYTNCDTKILMRHNKCNNIFHTRPADFIRGHGCPFCGGTMKKSHEKFKQEVYELVKDEYTILSPYILNRIKIL